MDYLLTSNRITRPCEPAAKNADAVVRAAFAQPCGLAAAQRYTRELARSHYENFSVISLLVPKDLRQDFANVYAFCRTADDLGDELGDPDRALEELGRFRQDTLACYEGRARSPLFVALQKTVERHHLPSGPFLNLIDAFEQDQRVSRYQTFQQLVDYCRRSADPVGRLVLCMYGYKDEQRQGLSDRTCTALQLANFWQDVRRDIVERDRIYLPIESMREFAVTERQIIEGRCDENFQRLIRFEVDRTEKMFDEGDRLLDLLSGRVRRQIMLFGMGGRAVLQAIRQQNYDTLSKRPSISKWHKSKLIFRAMLTWAVPPSHGRNGQ